MASLDPYIGCPDTMLEACIIASRAPGIHGRLLEFEVQINTAVKQIAGRTSNARQAAGIGS